MGNLISTQSKHIINLSTPANYTIFRSVRFPTRLNPFSLAGETFGQNEIRKISRKLNLPTRINQISTNEGNLGRSATLIIPSQRVFGCVGFGIVKKNSDDIKYFSFNMDYVFSGYGKYKKYDNFHNINDLSSFLDNYIRFFSNKSSRKKINEIVMDIKSTDISFIYFAESDPRIRDKFGVEDTNYLYKKLDSIYLQKEFLKANNINLPIFKYSINNTISSYDYTNSNLRNLLNIALNNKSNDRDLLPYIFTFEKEIKKDPYLNKLALSHLSKQVKLSTDPKYWTFEFDKISEPSEVTLYNKKLFALNCEINLAKCLNLYGQNNEASNVAENTLLDCIKAFSNSNDTIYKKYNSCSHPDIHMRNFTQTIDEIKKILSQERFNKYSSQINDTFDLVFKKSIDENSTAKMYISQYKSKCSFIRNERVFNN